MFLERSGFLQKSECNVEQAQHLCGDCGNFSQYGPGPGLAVWQGGGFWGDVWGFDFIHPIR